MSLIERITAEKLLAHGRLLSKFMPNSQRLTLKQNLRSEEGEYFAKLVIDLDKRISEMPHTYQTEAIEVPDKIVHLHYFLGNIDAWIIEKDMYCDRGSPQLQAYGKATLYGYGFNSAGWGYISIQEYIESGVELDLYWTPKPVKECK